jgi:outer membrane lipoprotein-sorting protein
MSTVTLQAKKTERLHRPFQVFGLLGLLCLVAASLVGGAQTPPTGDWVLRKVDDNRVTGNKVVLSEMVIHGRRGSRTIKAKSWIQGEDKSFSEYLDPPRERGIKMLKLGDQLWTYYPSTDRTILIAGHMLRQSVMGSDLSYEDMMEDPVLARSYEAKVGGEQDIGGRACWVLELTAKKSDVAYFSRKLWVDQERFVVLREERFARGGKLLKTADVRSVRQVQGRWIPDRLLFKDVLQTGEGTEFALSEIELDAAIPETVFSKASLKK